MTGYATIVTVIILILVLANLYTTYRRRHYGFDDDYYKPTGKHVAPPSNRQWKANASGSRADKTTIGDLDERLEKIREQVAVDVPVAAPLEDFSKLPPRNRKIKSLNVLNQYRGKRVKVITEEDIFEGEVVSLTGQEVILRDVIGTVHRVRLETITGITPQ